MSRRLRLIFLFLSFMVLVVVGRIATGGFDFMIQQFWFISGLFLLILLALVDQPHFSKDANIFVNGTTGWVSLMLVMPESRDGVWWIFFSWASYLIISSYVLMWVRTKELGGEGKLVQVTSRVNRQIGRPEALFSAFFLWGLTQQFGSQTTAFNALLLFWAVFMILNLPAVAQALDGVYARRESDGQIRSAKLLNIINPRIAELLLHSELPHTVTGRYATIRNNDEQVAAEGVIVDDRTVNGRRVGRMAITELGEGWTKIGDVDNAGVFADIQDDTTHSPDGWSPLSVVDTGTEIGKLAFKAHPHLQLEEGEVLWVEQTNQQRAFYQVVAGQVQQSSLSDGNYYHSVDVRASQLGFWDENRSRFEPVAWVPPAGHLVHRAGELSIDQSKIPDGQIVVGRVPNSAFPVHVNLNDIVTHNTAILGVTGSGKSYLAFHLIESMLAEGIKVLILDISRQHFLFLNHQNPTPLKKADDVPQWIASDSLLGIHQYAVDDPGYPAITAQFVGKAFDELSKTKLKAGVDEPARLCVIFEEAHSLIPEWNQVAQQGDTQQVNRTARIILQGRKYGMGGIIITQRTANVTKTILNQCNTIFALQTFDQTGLDFLSNYMGSEYAHTLSTLPNLHCVVVGKASSSTRPIMFRVEDFTDRWNNNNGEDAEDGSTDGVVQAGE